MMETRKLQVSGHSTYILSLPKTWIRENGIEKGDGIRLRLQPDGTILLTPSSSEVQRTEISVNVNESGDSLFRKFMGLYLAGYQIMNFDFIQEVRPEDKRKIREIVHKITGLEIIEERERRITVHDLFDPTLFSPEKALRRMHLLSRTMLRDGVDSFINNKDELAGDVLNRDEDVDLLNWLLTRQYNLILQDFTLSEKLNISPQRGLGYMLLGKSLERIGDHAAKIAIMEELHQEEEGSLHEDIMQLTNELVENIEQAVSSFFSKDLKMANEVLDRVRMVQFELNKLIKEGITQECRDVKTSISHAFLLDSLLGICAYTIDIAEVSINNQYIED